MIVLAIISIKYNCNIYQEFIRQACWLFC